MMPGVPGKMIQFHLISLKDDHSHSHGVTVLEKESALLSPTIPAIAFTLSEETSIEKLWCLYQTKKSHFSESDQVLHLQPVMEH